MSIPMFEFNVTSLTYLACFSIVPSATLCLSIKLLKLECSQLLYFEECPLSGSTIPRKRRTFTDEFKRQMVQLYEIVSKLL